MATAANKPARVLLATAGTIENIEKLINRFWCSEYYAVNRETLAIEHPQIDTRGFTVRLSRGRYRFESEA
jgi:hypothetical protein